MRSGFGIDDPCVANHIVTEVPAQIHRSAQVNFPAAQQLAQISLYQPAGRSRSGLQAGILLAHRCRSSLKSGRSARSRRAKASEFRCAGKVLQCGLPGSRRAQPSCSSNYGSGRRHRKPSIRSGHIHLKRAGRFADRNRLAIILSD